MPTYPVLPETDKIDEAQENLVTQFVNINLNDDVIPPAYQYLTTQSGEDKRIVAYKYLMARKWKMEDAVKMFKETCQWRESAGFHTRPLFPSPLIVRGYDVDELNQFFKMQPRPTNEPIDTITRRMYGAYSGSIHKWDKQGHPVTFDLGGQVNAHLAIKTLKELAPPGTPLSESMVQFRTFENEMLNFLVRFQDAKMSEKLNGRRVTSVTAVMDAKGLHMGMITSETVDLLKRILAVDQSHYPELLHRMVVVNCSSMVMMLFGLLKPFIDARIRAKFIFVNPSDTNDVLKSFIDEEHLPQRYGGSCNCEGGCIYTAGQDGTVSSDARDDEAKTVEIIVEAGKSASRGFVVEKGDTMVLEWESANGSDVEFEALFQPQKDVSGTPPVEFASPKSQVTSPIYETVDGKLIIAQKARMSRYEFSFTAPFGGTLDIVWGNTFSWLKSKNIRLRTEVLKSST